MKKAFTLAEIMITLVVIGVMLSMITPVILQLKPNKNKLMFKKAYYITERVINELVNDERYYPTTDGSNAFFVDESNVFVNGSDYFGLTKFCNLFAIKVNTVDTANCMSSQSIANQKNTKLNTGNFTTNDGIAWHLPTTAETGFTTVFKDGGQRDIIVDVNGTKQYSANTSPNCTYDAATCPKPDQFIIKVQSDGKLIVSGTLEKEYLQSSSIE
jgi:prepilin-type N-terminal cleavage/methylation domain-containing protein